MSSFIASIDLIETPSHQNEIISPTQGYQEKLVPKDILVLVDDNPLEKSIDRLFRQKKENDFSQDITSGDELTDIYEVKKSNNKKDKNNIINPNSSSSLTSQRKSIKKKKKFKIKKNVERKKKGKHIEKKARKTANDKERTDNIRLKFKRAFINSLINFLNSKMDNCKNLPKSRRFKKLSQDVIKYTKKDHSLTMLNIIAKDYLSNDIQKSKTLQPDHNKQLIKYIYENNETSIIQILNKSIRELMFIFVKDNDNAQEDDYKDFKRLNDYINDTLIEKYHKRNDYIELFKEQSLNYEINMNALKGRNENLYLDN